MKELPSILSKFYENVKNLIVWKISFPTSPESLVPFHENQKKNTHWTKWEVNTWKQQKNQRERILIFFSSVFYQIAEIKIKGWARVICIVYFDGIIYKRHQRLRRYHKKYTSNNNINSSNHNIHGLVLGLEIQGTPRTEKIYTKKERTPKLRASCSVCFSLCYLNIEAAIDTREIHRYPCPYTD